MGVSIDTPSDPNRDLLDLVVKGGQGFLDRLGQIANQKAGLDQALAQLNLGKSAQDAYNEASTLKDQASKDRQAAADALTAARVEASKIVAEAQTQVEKSKADLAAKHAKVDAVMAALK